MNSEAISSGLRSYGQFRTITSTISCVVVTILLLIAIGYFVKLAKEDMHYASTRATMSNVQCSGPRTSVTTHKDGKTHTEQWYDCSAHLSYEVAGVPYAVDLPLQSRQTPYVNGESIVIHYNPAHPADAILNPPISEKYLYPSAALLVVVCIACCWYGYVVYNHKIAATVAGATGAVSDVSNIARMF